VSADQGDRDAALRERYSCSKADEAGPDYDYVAGQGVDASRFLS
jgi:hypothetical protein